MGYCGLSWQLSLTLMGLAGVVFGLLFLLLFRNSPDVHTGVNEQERLLISEGGSTVSVSATLPWSKALKNRSLFFFTLQQFMDAGSDVVFVSLIGKYFLARHGLDIKSVGWLASLPLWGGALGGIVGGWLNDRLILATGNRRWSRSGIGFVGKLVGCLMLYVVSSQNAPLEAGLALMFAKFFSDWSQPTVWGTCTDLGGRCSATVFSIINTAGTVAGGILPVLFGRLLDWNTTQQIVDGVTIKQTDWGPLFLVLASMYLASGIFWLLIDCTRAIDPEAALTPAST
jgi:nitrate/nitrite transporter NarK